MYRWRENRRQTQTETKNRLSARDGSDGEKTEDAPYYTEKEKT